MKQLLCLMLLAFGSTGSIPPVCAQQVQREVFTVAEQMPVFPGGNTALYRFLSKKIKYPKKAKLEKTTGKVVVRFIVEPDGSVSHPEVLSKVGNGCEEEILRVIGEMPRWNPGMQDGAFVAVYYTLPVSFSF